MKKRAPVKRTKAKRAPRRVVKAPVAVKRIPKRRPKAPAAVAAPVMKPTPPRTGINAPNADNWKNRRKRADAKEAASKETILARQALSPPPDPLPPTDAEWDALIRMLPKFDPYALAGECQFVPEAAVDAIEFIEAHVRHHEGELGGQLLRLRPWQRSFIANLFGWLRPDGLTRRFSEALLYVAKKNGKALALDTPIPTPSGWTTMGEVRVGDFVFDENGEPCRVVDATEVMRGRLCYRVSFDDGTSIVADAEHEWYTDAYRTGRAHGVKGVSRDATKQTFRDHIRTTERIRDTLTFACGGPAVRAANHSIPNCAPLQSRADHLPVEPYTLGAWLGDGSSGSAEMTCAMVDYQIIDEINADGYESGAPRFNKKESPGTATVTITPGRQGHKGKSRLRRALMEAGVADGKNIPAAYLRASVEQRTALLQGLMDTDGCVSEAGQCEFTTTSEALWRGFVELARSLGYKPNTFSARATIYGRDVGPKWRVNFWSYSDRPCFRLARKAARLRPPPTYRARSMRRQIVAVDPVESVPVRCVQVDSPSHLYLAGPGMVPTHNSLLCEGIALYLFHGDGVFGAKVYCAAAKRDQARIIWNGCLWQIQNDEALDALCERYQYEIKKADTGFLKPISADASKEDGMNPSGFVLDELHRQPDSRLLNMARLSMKTRRNSLLVCLTTSDADGESVCNDEWRRFSDVRDNPGDPTKPGHFSHMLPAIFEAGPEDDWTTEAAWRAANPNLGVTIPLEEVEIECRAAKENPGLEADFRRYRLNQRVKTTSRMFDMIAWDKCGGPPIDPASLAGRSCVVAIDLASTTDLVAQVALFPSVPATSSSLFLPAVALAWFWCPEAAADDRLAVDKRNVGIYRAWKSRGFLTLTSGDQIDEDRVCAEMIANVSGFRVREWAFDPWNASRYTQRLMALGVPVTAVRQGGWTMNEPLKALSVAIGRGEFRHGGNPVLRWMANNAEREDTKAGWILGKAKGSAKIDGISALATAWARAMVLPGDKPRVDPATMATFVPFRFGRS